MISRHGNGYDIEGGFAGSACFGSLQAKYGIRRGGGCRQEQTASQMKKNVNIVLLVKDFNWGGGIDLLRMITNSLLIASRGTPLRLTLLVPRKRKKKLLRWGASLLEKIRNPLPLAPVRNNRKASESFRDFLLNIPDEVEAFHHGYSFGSLVACLQELRADVVLPAAFPPEKTLPVPWIGYIGDF